MKKNVNNKNKKIVTSLGAGFLVTGVAVAAVAQACAPNQTRQSIARQAIQNLNGYSDGDIIQEFTSSESLLIILEEIVGGSGNQGARILSIDFDSNNVTVSADGTLIQISGRTRIQPDGSSVFYNQNSEGFSIRNITYNNNNVINGGIVENLVPSTLGAQNAEEALRGLAQGSTAPSASRPNQLIIYNAFQTFYNSFTQASGVVLTNLLLLNSQNEINFQLNNSSASTITLRANTVLLNTNSLMGNSY